VTVIKVVVVLTLEPKIKAGMIELAKKTRGSV